jgi:hypothetical protein
MKRLTATVIGAFAFLIFVVSPAHAITISKSALANGKVTVKGNGATPLATILWEGSAVKTANRAGKFNFSTTDLPSDCVGKLSDGVTTIQVGVGGCTTGTRAEVAATGQTTSFAAGDDGDLEKGVASPDPRFTDNLNGTITDNLTGLIWLKDANCFGARTWALALSDVNGLNTGECGLTDGSVAGDWRLPNLRELQSLVDYGQFNPALPLGHPFTNFQASFYWSSTTDAGNSGAAWDVVFSIGFNGNSGKS